MRKTSLLTVAWAMACVAQTVDRTKPPASPEPRPYKLPPVYETKLPNGLTIMLAEDKRVPLVTVRLVFTCGNRRDPKEIPGLAASTASMLIQGTKTRTYQQIAEQLDAMGASMNAASGADQVIVQGSVLSDKLPSLLDLMADVSRNATFPESELTLHKQNRKQGVAMEHANSGFLANEAFRKAVFQEHPYSRIGPTPASIDKMDQKVLMEYRDTFLVPNNAYLIVVGSLPARAAVMKTITTLFGSWQQKALPEYKPAAVPAASKQMVLVDRPGSVQADIQIGRTAATKRDSDYFPQVVASNILGGGTNSRLFLDVREKRGFAYGVYAVPTPLDEAAALAVSTQIRNEVAAEGLVVVRDHMDRMAKEAVSSEELRDAKNLINGMFLIRLEPQAGLADQLVSMKVQNLPKDYLETYTTKINSVEPGQVQAVAKKYLETDNSTFVVVGDAEKLKESLDKVGKFTVVKPPQ